MRGFNRCVVAFMLCLFVGDASPGLASITRAPLAPDVFRAQALFAAGIHIATLHGAAAKAPSGYRDFCERSPDQCKAKRGDAREVALSDDLRQTLEAVNEEFNRSIVAEDDLVHYGTLDFWTIPADGRGDCEDYVLAKRQALMRLGLPEPALRIAVVFTRKLIRHTVLTVATDKGNYVLDNLRSDIVTWEETNYVFVERQDPDSASGWVSLD